ncbi:Na/Pi cotransporter family protein [uncultured Eubacterium sp.]|uniref:Na/Pi cotransporter family protein n=1 Tax=uncultured Eubacterium sp. TaxID=165185 RepID=UPI00280516EA|nr:Na/Pi cotransporter family protein [uncultured Eubacterium sp.]
MTIFDFLTFVGGLAMFLFGMSYMGSSLEKIGGGKFESVLEKMTDNRIKGVLLGAGITAIIQSSSAVTVMAVGFVNSGIMGLHQVIGIIMGANIGTTITGWILSLTNIDSSNILISMFKPTSFTPILAIIGIIMFMVGKKDKVKSVGSILLGFTVLIFGMTTMTTAVEPLKDVKEFTGILTMFSNPLLGVLFGAVLTAIIQSSSASVGILQALAITGSISVSTAFPIILGQNIGTCITAILSSIGANKNAKRTAVVHLLFNVIGVSLAMALFYGLNAIFKFSFYNETANAASIAVIHTLFNVFATVVLFPFATQIEKLACVLVPESKKEKNTALIDEKFLMSPSYALDKVKERCDKMGTLAQENVELCLDILKKYSHNKDEIISKNEKQLDKYEDELETYLVKISSMDLSNYDSIRLSKLSHSISNFERIGDYGTNILKIKRRMHDKNIHFTQDANAELNVMAKAVKEIVEKSISAFIADDIDAAREIEPLEQVIDNLKNELRARHAKRLQNNECTIENGMIFFDIINSYERIADHCSNLAVCIIELSKGSYQTHAYLKSVKSSSNKSFMELFEEYLLKYKVS